MVDEVDDNGDANSSGDNSLVNMKGFSFKEVLGSDSARKVFLSFLLHFFFKKFPHFSWGGGGGGGGENLMSQSSRGLNILFFYNPTRACR